MTPEEHRQRHIKLHRMLDELVADWVEHGPKRPGPLVDDYPLPSKRTVLELMTWSAQQARQPDHEQGDT